MRLELDPYGHSEAADRLVDMAARATDARPVFTRIIGKIMEAERRRFATGRGFKKLAKSTVEEKKRKGLSPLKLVATGAYRDSLTRVGARHQKLFIDPDSARLFTTLYYARFHQRGQGVPRRRVLTLAPKLRRDIVDDIAGWIVGSDRP